MKSKQTQKAERLAAVTTCERRLTNCATSRKLTSPRQSNKARSAGKKATSAAKTS
jgi:hypothetical protein